MGRALRDLHAIVIRHPRRVGGDDGENDIALVQDFVVFEIVQQRRGGKLRLAGEKHRCARHDMRRVLAQACQQSIERHFAAPRFAGEDVGTPAPRQDQEHHRGAEQDGRPSAFE